MMTLKSAFEDVKETTLAAIAGLLGKLSYLASLRSERGNYQHWGMESVYGKESSARAWRAVHMEIIAAVLRTPLSALEEDLELSSRNSGVAPRAYVETMLGRFDRLLPNERRNSPSAIHLNSVLAALSSLKRNRGRATRSAS